MSFIRNSKYQSLFNDEDKIKYFDEIAEMFYDCNFSSTNKADVELKMFSLYLKQLVDHNLPYDDYSISRHLGITESRVRSLKTRNQLIYPQDNDWIQLFFNCLENVDMDEGGTQIVVSVNEVTVMTELQHYVDIHNGQYGKKMNSKQITFSLGFFFNMLGNLIQECDVTFDKEKFIDDIFLKLNENYNSNVDKEKIVTKENWLNKLRSNAVPTILELMKKNPKTELVAIALDAALFR